MYIDELIGKRVHFRGYNKGCNWVLQKIEGEKAICFTPKTHKQFIGNLKDIYPSKKYAENPHNLYIDTNTGLFKEKI